MGPLWDALCRACDALGFEEATEGDAVFRQLVLAHIIEPTSKLDSLQVLAETGIEPVSSGELGECAIPSQQLRFVCDRRKQRGSYPPQ
jgi:hypothetical protein